jgi:hypothetical protein
MEYDVGFEIHGPIEHVDRHLRLPLRDASRAPTRGDRVNGGWPSPQSAGNELHLFGDEPCVRAI